MPRRRPPLPDALKTTAFSPGDAERAGISRGRLRHSGALRAHRGVYVVDPPADLFDRCQHALPLLGAHRWFSHLTAARLWGIPLPFSWTPDEPVHVLTLPGAEPLRRPGIVGWESGDHPGGVVLAGLPLVPPAAVWAQLSVPGALGRDAVTARRRSLDARWMTAAGDFLVTGPRQRGGRVPLCTPAELAAAADARRGRRGVKALTEALGLVRPGPQSPRESMLRLALVDHGLPEPTVQPAIATSAGIRHPDLGYPERGVLIEYHGDHHRTDARQWREDLVRRQLFEEAGFRLLEAAADVFDDGCLAFATRVRRALAR